jgi:hypothetical protein
MQVDAASRDIQISVFTDLLSFEAANPGDTLQVNSRNRWAIDGAQQIVASERLNDMAMHSCLQVPQYHEKLDTR